MSLFILNVGETMRSDLYYQYNPWWEEPSPFSQTNIIHRPRLLQALESIYSDPGIVFITGLRRVGKTSFLKTFITHLIEKGIDPKYIFYVSVDEYRFKDLTLIDLIDEYRKLHRIRVDTKIHVFLDEITYKPDYQQQLKNLYDKGEMKLVVTSSCSSALRDSRAFLTGRVRWLEVSPLDFSEYLLFKKIDLKKRDQGLLESYFEDYLRVGGMPEFVLREDRDYLRTVVDDIIYKDIVAFHGIKQPYLMKDFFHLLMERVGKQISMRKVANILGISQDTVKRHLHLFEETFLIDTIPRYGKTNEMLLSPRKVYAADLGIRNLFTGVRDKGSLFENAVFQKIKRLRPRYLYQDGVEIDFLTENKILIEVKYGRELQTKQQMLFEKYEGVQKYLIASIEDYLKIEDWITGMG